jgi:hypothetical protein
VCKGEFLKSREEANVGLLILAVINFKAMDDPNSLIEKTLQKHIEEHRPPEETRPKLDIGYTLEGQAIFLNEIRPRWDNPEEIRHYPYAKIRYIKSKGLFKLYWLRASGKWELYAPFPESSYLQKVLDVVEEDGLGCFKG